MKAMYIFIIILMLLVMGIFLFPKSSGNLPGYAMTNPLLREAYTFAVEEPEQLDGINCYCGCMQHLHEGRIHRRGLLDCFVTESGSFDRHASSCDMCISDALEVKRMAANGKTKSEIKAAIDSKYR